MRVALLSGNARASDAIGNQIAEKVAFFRERGAEARVLVTDGRQLHPSLRPHACTLSDTTPQGDAWEFAASADLVVVEFAQDFPLLGWLPLLAGGKPRLLFDYHGITPLECWGPHHREHLERGRQQRGLAWFADAALVHSQFTALELRRPTGLPSEQTHVLGYAVDTNAFCPGVPLQDVRAALGLQAATLLLFVGRLAPNKRVPVLVEALARLRDLTPPVHAAVVGDTTDVYAAEAARCRERAVELGVADRLHFLGQVSQEQLRDAYRCADIFVMPSRHEGFCIPVLEAMACGVPVVAARAGALPETVADAGLTFEPDDADDLARQVRRVLRATPVVDGNTRNAGPLPVRVAVVAHRYGKDFAGGAERSLRTMALALHAAAQHVEVFTTCNRAEGQWSNELPAGTMEEDCIPVHRFRIDAHDRGRHLESFRAILEAAGAVSPAAEHDYLTHSLHASQLVDALQQRIGEFDAVLVGPYLFGLTHDVACAFRDKVLLLPCFHDEPLARLRLWRAAYREIGGVLYHSPEEKAFAECELGLNHPGGMVSGTHVDTTLLGDANRGRRLVYTPRRYLVYAGRYSAHKNLPVLLDFARRYQTAHADRFTFVFLGHGEVAIPQEGWARDLGFVSEACKRDVLAGADAVVQLSVCESLSLVALEAWTHGVPVLAHQGCSVLRAQVGRSGGGVAVASFEDFAAALDDLWEKPQRWQAMGRHGREYVQAEYGSESDFSQRLVAAIRDRARPLPERMRRRGLARAAEHDRPRWRERFGQIVETILDSPSRPLQHRVAIEPRTATRSVSAGAGSVLIPVRIHNDGAHPLVPAGPGHTFLCGQVIDAQAQPCTAATATPLPALLLPGRTLTAAVNVAVPTVPGSYRVRFQARTVNAGAPLPGDDGPGLRLEVHDRAAEGGGGCASALLDAVQAALAEAQRRQSLPDDYLDVTQGLLAAGKQWLKRKLLNNFKRAYLDVLSRQQSAFNQHVLSALHELAECCALLDHAGRQAEGTEERSSLLSQLIAELAENRRGWADLERRLARLERLLARKPRKNRTPHGEKA